MSEEMVSTEAQPETREDQQDAEKIEITPTLTIEQEIHALRKVHEFLAAFDRVPGGMAASWGQVLDMVATVGNSLIGKAEAANQAAKANAEAAGSAEPEAEQLTN